MNALVQAVGQALVHSLWQGALVAALLALALKLAPARAARVRYALACAALLLVCALPIVTVFHVAEPLELTVAPTPPVTPSAAFANGAQTAAASSLSALQTHAHWIVLAWAFGVLLASGRVLLGWRQLVRLTRAADPTPPEWQARLDQLRSLLGVRGAVQLLASVRVEVPSTVGLFRPVILLPLSVLSGLAERELELILAHELAHIHRFDYLLNLLQTAAETLLFYHPAVWWIGTVIRDERENCCDDLAVSALGSPVTYARALTALEVLRTMPEPALYALGGSLPARVRRLIAPPSRCASRWSIGASLLSILGGLALALPVAAAALPRAARVTPAPAPVATQDADEEEDSTRVVGRDQLTVDDLVALRNAGIDAARLRDLKALGFEPTVSNLVELGHAGATPESARALRQAFPSLSLDQLVSMHHVGVTPEYVRMLQSMGFAKLAADDVTGARAVGVTEQWAHDLSAVGVQAKSLDDLVSLRALGVDADYVREMQKAGFSKLGVHQLQELRAGGITPDYLRSLQGK